MSSERRTVRPYVGLGRFQHLLDGFVLRLGAETVSPNQSALVRASDLVAIPLVVSSNTGCGEVMGQARAAAQDLNLEPSDIDFLITMSTPYLRLLDLAHRATLDEADAICDDMSFMSAQARALATPTGGCDVDLYFVLNAHRPSEPLRPSRKGTWLARTRFHLRTELGELGFIPQPLTDEIRAEKGLAKDTIRYVEIEPELLLDEDLPASVTLFLDEHLLAILNGTPNTSAARSLQRQLFLDVIGAVLRDAPGKDGLELADLDGSVLGRIIDAAAGAGTRGEDGDAGTARREAALADFKTRPSRFMARMEAKVEPRDDLKASLLGGEQ